MLISSHRLPEEQRLQDLYAYNILDSEAESDFNELVDLVMQIYDCPLIALTFVDRDRLWFKAIKGAEATEAPRQHSPCHYAIEQDEVMIVQDMLEDERFSGNELLTQLMKLRFYAGAPIVSPAGYKLGTVCIYDHKPRRLTQKHCIGLKAVANQANKLLQLKARNNQLRQQAAELLLAEKKLTHAILQQQEKQRMSIGIELHENIAQGLAATKLYLETMSKTVDHPFMAVSGDTVSLLLQQVKDLTHSIVPTTLQSAGLESLLSILAERYRKLHSLDVQFTYNGTKEPDEKLSLEIYRMVEKAFENARVHAKASNIRLCVTVAGEITVSIADNGSGMNLQTFTKGAGINSIITVTEQHGGTVDLTSTINKGTTLRFQLPLNGQRLSAAKVPTAVV